MRALRRAAKRQIEATKGAVKNTQHTKPPVDYRFATIMSDGMADKYGPLACIVMLITSL